jgi:hypothetical protein
MRDKCYYIGTGDREKGPFTLKQLRAAAQDASLKASTLVRVEDETERRPLEELLVATRERGAKPRRYHQARRAAKGEKHPAEEDQISSTGFCSKCLRQSTSEAPEDVSYFPLIGRTFYGRAEKCSTCFSVVRVLWWVFCVIPVIPLGSYRFQSTDSRFFDLAGDRFVGRLTQMRWRMVLTHWLIALVSVLVFYFFRDVYPRYR